MNFALDDAGEVRAPIQVTFLVEPRWVIHVTAWLLAHHEPTTPQHIRATLENMLRVGGVEHMRRYPQGWTKKIKNDHEVRARDIFEHNWPGVPIDHIPPDA